MLSLPILLFLSMVALLFGAFLGQVLQKRGWGLAALKGLMASFIGGLLIFHLLPDAYAKVGPLALFFVLLGLISMILPERLFRQAHDQEPGRFFTAEMVWLGLILHEATDGIGLALASSEVLGSWPLALVVIAHRIPVAAVVFWLFLRRSDRRQAWLRIAAMGTATCLGALFSRTLEPLLTGNAIYYFYAFITGSFFHLVFHDFVDYHAHQDRDRRAEFLAFMVGVAALFAIGTFSAEATGHLETHAHGEPTQLGLSFLANFLILVRETAPFLLLGLIISGLLYAFLPMSPIKWIQKGGPLTQSVKGMAFGLPLPICSCGVLPLFLSLARKGVPPACAVAFLIATPELGVDSFLLSVRLLGVEFTAVRLVVAAVLPILIALTAVRFLPKQAIPGEEKKSCCHHKEAAPVADLEQDPEPKGAAHATKSHASSHDHGNHGSITISEDNDSKPEKRWWEFAFISLVDDIFPFVFFGLMVAAVAQTLWPSSELGSLVGHWDVLLLALTGIPFYVCASASVPFALVLLQHGFSVGAVVVFLFAGPATNIATVLTTDKVYGKGMGLKLAATAFVFALITGFTINAFYQPVSLDINELHQHGWSVLALISSVALGGLTLASLYRNGPLHWISNVLAIIPGLSGHPH